MARTPATTTDITTIPYAPRQEQAKGFLAPLIRMMGHVLYLAAAHTTLTPEEAKKELEDAAAHIDASLVTNSPMVSGTAKSYIKILHNHLIATAGAWEAYTEEQRTTNLSAVANRTAGAASYFDIEFAGLTADETDPGSSL